MIRKKITISTQLENIRDCRTSSNKFENLDKTDNFVGKYRLLKLTLLEIKTSATQLLKRKQR